MLAILLTYLYKFCGIAGFFGYIPQIIRLWHDTTKAASTSLATWSWWTFMSSVAFAYAWMINKDPVLILVASSNFVGCWMVFCLAFLRRIK